jgi:hypothetical protein
MPKQPSALYNHNARNAISRQLNISSTSSGRSSYSYRSSQVPVEFLTPDAHTEHEYYAADARMDIDDDELDNPEINASEDGGPIIIEVMPGVRAITKVKVKRYENSVSDLAL